jgi:hypothetical protein
MSGAIPLFPRACAIMPRTGSTLFFSTSFSRRNPRSGISNSHAGRQSILKGLVTDVIPIAEFGPAQCQVFFVTAVRALNVPLSLGGNGVRRERVRAQLKQFFRAPQQRGTG